MLQEQQDENDAQLARIQGKWAQLSGAIGRLLGNEETELVFEKHRNEVIIKQRGGKQHSQETLPSGYRAAFDIFGRLFMLVNHWDLGIDQVKGLVLIDELETHLHIAMQKAIFPCLSDLFPNVQFIIATHSPFVLNSAKNAVIFDMENLKQVADASEVNEYGLQGWGLDEVMDTVLDVKDEESLAFLSAKDRFETAIEHRDVAQAQAAYAELDAMMGSGNYLRQAFKLDLIRIGGGDHH